MQLWDKIYEVIHEVKKSNRSIEPDIAEAIGVSYAAWYERKKRRGKLSIEELTELSKVLGYNFLLWYVRQPQVVDMLEEPVARYVTEAHKNAVAELEMALDDCHKEKAEILAQKSHYADMLVQCQRDLLEYTKKDKAS